MEGYKNESRPGGPLHKANAAKSGTARFCGVLHVYSETVLARMIRQAKAEMQQAKKEYAELLKNDFGRGTVQQIRKYYDEFLSWANEFDLALVSRKRSVLAQLFGRVELGRGYQVKIVARGSYQQFIGETIPFRGSGSVLVQVR